MRSLCLCITILLASATIYGQELPRWPANSSLQITAPGFNDKERTKIDAAIKNWRSQLVNGLTIDWGTGNVRIVRQPIKGGKLEECKISSRNGFTHSVVIRIDTSDNFQLAVEHAIGHALGLGHRPNSVMAPHAPDSLRIAFWKIKGKTYHPDERDREQLRVLYAQALVVAQAAPVAVEAEAPADVPTTAPAQRYSFRRVVTIGNKRRESTFTFNDKGEQVETDVVGSNDKAFKKIPVFPVGLGSEAVFNDWRSRPAVNRYVVRWENAKELSIDGAGDEALRFPVVAHTDKIRVEFSHYKLFRTSVSIKELPE